jgi:polyhydroxybutyrate depolymerase
MRRLAALALVAALGCHEAMVPAGDDRPATVATPEASGGCRPGRQAALRGTRGQLVVAGETRQYLLDVPAGAADRALPVVLDFHGFRGSARQLRWWTGFAKLAHHSGFIAVHPDGHDGVRLLGTTGRGWDLRPGDTYDLGFVGALLDTLEREYCVDRRRIFATGMSNGGFFANLLGCLMADRLAAVAPVAGALALRGCTPARPMPVLLIYGRGDHIVRPEMIEGARDWWAETDRCGAPAEADGCRQYADCGLVACAGTQGHWWPSGTTERIWHFFQAHSN